MGSPYVRDIGAVDDIDEATLTVGVDYDTVTLSYGAHADPFRLSRDQAEEFAHLFVMACFEAGASGARMKAEAAEGGGGG